MSKANSNTRTLFDSHFPKVMGILNVTPDSFSDGGRFTLLDAALHQTETMLSEGAAIIDVGGESTRPGAADVSVAEELDRVIPVIEKISAHCETIISIDTSKPEVMREAVNAGAGLINDVNALQSDGAVTTVQQLAVPVCLMHMQGQPRTMQVAPVYENVTDEVMQFLQQRANECVNAGIEEDKIIIDPGFGFGKTLEHNLQLMHDLNRFSQLPYPLLVGVSRKSMLGQILDVDVSDRLIGTVALETLAVWKGARIIRAHDVKAAFEAIKVTMAVKLTEL